MSLRTSAYRIMWIFVLFDLPTETKTQRKEYSEFRKFLLNEGFSMMQFSVYMRHCISREFMESKLKRLETKLPRYGNVTIMEVTDKQFSMIKHFYCSAYEKPPPTPQQIGMF